MEKTLYLIVKCVELDDQWECDAKRTPITLTNDWRNWYETEKPKYLFEVYEFTKGNFHRRKEYDQKMKRGK